MQKCRWLLALALFVGAGFFHQPMEYDNTKSRYMLLEAMVDQRRLSIDSYQDETIDKAFFGGHYYSNKAIGLPFLAAPLYWVLRRAHWVSPVMGDPAARYLTRLAVVTAPSVLLVLLMFSLMLDLGASQRAAFWACVAYGFGTISLNHASLFSGHQTSAFFLLTSFVVLHHVGRKEASREARSTALCLLAGLCAGLAVLCDYIAVFSAVILAWYALTSNSRRRDKASFVAGAASCAVVLAWYNRACFGRISTLSYSYNAFGPFHDGASAGLFGIAWPGHIALLSLLGSVSRGLFFISPVLFFAVVGFDFLRRRAPLRREAWVIGLATAATVLANAGFYGWNGGWTFGPRYLVPVLPFLALPMALTADGGPWFFWLLALSVFQVACAQIGWPHVSYDSLNPIAEMILPLMGRGGTALSLFGLARPGALAAGVLQYGFVAALLMIAPRGLPKERRRRRLPWRWRALMGAWSVCVVSALILVRSPDQPKIHFCRSLVLKDTAAALGSPVLADEARAERLLGPPPGANNR